VENVGGDVVRGPADGDCDSLGGLGEVTGMPCSGVVTADGYAVMVPTAVGPAEQELGTGGIDEPGAAVVG